MRVLPWWQIVFIVIGTGCADDKVACGEGTHEENGLCLPSLMQRWRQGAVSAWIGTRPMYDLSL